MLIIVRFVSPQTLMLLNVIAERKFQEIKYISK